MLGSSDIEQTQIEDFMNTLEVQVQPHSKAIMYIMCGRVPCENHHKLNLIINELKKSLEEITKTYLTGTGRDFLFGANPTLADLQLASYLVYPLSFAMNAQWRNKVLDLMSWYYRITELEGHFPQVFGKVKLSTKVFKPPKVKKQAQPSKKKDDKKKDDKKEEKKKKKDKKKQEGDKKPEGEAKPADN